MHEIREGNLVIKDSRIFLEVPELGLFSVHSVCDIDRLGLDKKVKNKNINNRKSDKEVISELTASGHCFEYDEKASNSLGFNGYVYPTTLILLSELEVAKSKPKALK